MVGCNNNNPFLVRYVTKKKQNKTKTNKQTNKQKQNKKQNKKKQTGLIGVNK